ncbi:MAG: hypothetical protein IT579_01735 [Verrucomicrobia subdivision 3 bacterium]|nr:hypothetical protein [Limisphaerales bacterium]
MRTLFNILGLSLLLLTPCADAGTNQPLTLHPDNPHYFLFRGQPAILISSGEHYGAVLNLDFDYSRYLDELAAKKLNHTRTFSGTYRELPSSFGITDNTLSPKPGRYLAPWPRSDTPGYADGGNKFDLTRWDEAYFRRVKDFITQAGRRGIVVEISLFCPLYDEELWQASPMNARNNVNHVGHGGRNEVLALKHPDLTEVQKNVTRKLVAELAAFDNVYLEVCNEPWMGGVTTEWQNEIIATIVESQSAFANRQLIALNPLGLNLKNPNPAVSIFNYHHAAAAEPAVANYHLNRVIGDNETGFRGRENLAYRTEAWDCILAGGAVFSSLDYSFTPKHPDGSFLDYKSPGGGNAELRDQLRILKEFIYGFDFIRLAPDDSILKAIQPAGLRVPRVLAEKGRAYAIYLRTRTDVDTFSVRWTGSVTPADDDTYTFHVVSNNGVRLWVNDQLLIDNPRDHKPVEDQGQIRLAAGRKATIRLEYYQAGNDALAKLLWSRTGSEKTVIASPLLTPPDGTGTGLQAEYFADRKLTKRILTRSDTTIDFDWSKAGPFSQPVHAVPVDLTLELPAGDYRAEWLDPKNGTVTRREDFQHRGGDKTLTSPAFTEDAALRLVNRAKP